MTDLTTNNDVCKQKSGLSALTGHTLSVAGCAFSPDGRRIAPAGYDNMLKVWEADSGSLTAQVEFPGANPSVSWHPWKAWVACGGLEGILYRIELVGLELGPIVVSASVHDRTLAVLCPACQQRFQIDNSSLGSEITCPNEGCNTRLKVNPFVIRLFQG